MMLMEGKCRWAAIVVLLAGALVLQADTPYQEIVNRNAFGLNPPKKEEPVVVPAPVVPQPTIVLSGMVQMNGKKQVFLSVLAQGEKEAKHHRLGEQERAGQVEIGEIDLKQERVRAKVNGQPVLLTFLTHGAKAAIQPPAPSAVPPMPPGAPMISKPVAVRPPGP